MRKIEPTTQFKRDYKRESKGRYRKILDELLKPVIGMLADDVLLPDKYVDHALTGNWVEHRDCHIKPDLVLIYKKPNAILLQLIRVGSHSELGL